MATLSPTSFSHRNAASSAYELEVVVRYATWSWLPTRVAALISTSKVTGRSARIEALDLGERPEAPVAAPRLNGVLPELPFRHVEEA